MHEVLSLIIRADVKTMAAKQCDKRQNSVEDILLMAMKVERRRGNSCYVAEVVYQAPVV